jgi:Membrane-associated sensor domain
MDNVENKVPLAPADGGVDLPSMGHGSYITYIGGVLLLIGIGAMSFVNFPLFHTVAEVVSIVIACSIFVVAWNTRHICHNNYLLFLGIMYLFVGILDFAHALSYKGMNVFVGYGSNLPTQLWISARYLEGISLAIAPIFFVRRLNMKVVFGVYSGLCTLVFISLFAWPVFPDCFLEGSGLTAFKIVSEHIICLILCGAIVALYRRREHLDKATFRLIVLSICLTIIGELAFTFYVDVFGMSNLVGHLFKIASFFLIYHATIVVTLTTPYRNMFHKLVESRDAQEHVIVELEEALQQVKLLQGFLPICASCKQVRDDNGYWSQIEQYISDHSDVQFSHSLCPKCAQEQFPEYYEEKGDGNPLS